MGMRNSHNDKPFLPSISIDGTITTGNENQETLVPKVTAIGILRLQHVSATLKSRRR